MSNDPLATEGALLGPQALRQIAQVIAEVGLRTQTDHLGPLSRRKREVPDCEALHSVFDLYNREEYDPDKEHLLKFEDLNSGGKCLLEPIEDCPEPAPFIGPGPDLLLDTVDQLPDPATQYTGQAARVVADGSRSGWYWVQGGTSFTEYGTEWKRV